MHAAFLPRMCTPTVIVTYQVYSTFAKSLFGLGRWTGEDPLQFTSIDLLKSGKYDATLQL
jgi:hypothetical protein